MTRRAVGAGLLLLAIYVGLSFFCSPRGFLGTDTGGKVATLRVMAESGRFDPDLGYWAERWDPDGALHPLSNTSHTASGRWVNVTSLPALWAGWLLFWVGGYRAALLVPMAGAVASAFAGRALLRRLGVGERAAWEGYWLIGLASPLAVYALDFWEHTLGVALMAWAVVALGRGWSWRQGLAAGALFGGAATMRTESLVYLAVAGLAWGVSGLRGRRPLPGLVAAGGALVVGAAGPVLLNGLVERRVVGSTIRVGRVAGTALGIGDEAGSRLREAATTLVGLEGTSRGIVLGGLLVALLVFAAVRRDAGAAAVGVVGAFVLAALRFAGSGLGFVPGLGPAWILPAAALPTSGRDPAEISARSRSDVRTLGLAVAVGAIPLVLAAQFRGGAAPQWAGRYLLLSGFVLAVLGWARLQERPPRLRAAFAGLAAAVTLAGVAWLAVRSHDVDRAFAVLEDRPEEVLVSDLYFFVREGGATYGDQRWLTLSPNPGGTAEAAARVLDQAGVDTFAGVQLPGSPPLDFPGFEPAGRPDDVRLFDGVDLVVTSYRRTG